MSMKVTRGPACLHCKAQTLFRVGNNLKVSCFAEVRLVACNHS